MRHITRSLIAIAALASVPTLAAAQLLDPRPAPVGAPRASFGLNFAVGQPVDEFSNYVDQGFGGNAHFIWNLDRRGILGLRIDGGILNYGHETKRVPLSGTIGGRILVDVNTSNNIVDFSIGPQLSVPSGPIRPYIAGGVGGAYFVTSSSVEGVDDIDDRDLFNTTNLDDWTWSYSGAAGFLIPISLGRTSRSTFAIDFAARYHSNGRVQYLKEGGIIDNADGSITLLPIDSRADLVTYHLGVRIGIR
jgi:hypothetical protein